MESVSRVKYAVMSLRPGAESYADLATKVTEAYAQADANPDTWEEAQLTFIAEVADLLAALPAERWNDFDLLMTDFKAAANIAGARNGLKGKGIWMTLRMALTGREHGPEVGRLVGMWGREGTLNRLAHGCCEQSYLRNRARESACTLWWSFVGAYCLLSFR